MYHLILNILNQYLGYLIKQYHLLLESVEISKDLKSFISYLGLYPTQYQSGNSLSIGKLAKRGIPIAKHSLYLAAVASVRHNIELNQLFRNKVSSGKSKKEALIIVAKKLATIIYSLFKYNQPYNPNRVFIQYRK